MEVLQDTYKDTKIGRIPKNWKLISFGDLGEYYGGLLGKTKVKLSDMQPLARGTDDPQLFVVNCKEDIKDAKKFVSIQKKKALSYGTTHTGGIDDASLTNEVLTQRRYSLFGEGHRWIDMRRAGRLGDLPIDRAGDEVFTQFPRPVLEPQ